MFTLALVVVSIALVAAFANVIVNYVPVDAIVRYKAVATVEGSVKRWERGIEIYFDANKDIDGDVMLPGATTDMIPILVSEYLFLPATPGAMDWESQVGTLGTDAGVWVCLKPSGTLSAPVKDALLKVRSKFPVGSTFVNTACGASSTDTVNGDRLTFWMIAAHYAG